MTIALGFLYPFSDFELPRAMHTIHNSSLPPVIFCIILMPSLTNFSCYTLQQGNPFLFSSVVKDLKNKFSIYHPVIFKNFKEREEVESGSQCAICINSYVTLSMEHPFLSLAVLAFDSSIIFNPWAFLF